MPVSVSPLPALHHKVPLSGSVIRDGLTGGTFGGGCASIVGNGNGAYFEWFTSLDSYATRSQLVIGADGAEPRAYITRTLDGVNFTLRALATSTPPEEHSAAMASGLVGTYYYRINQFQELKLSGDAGNPKGFPPNSDIILADLPIGYRPVRDTIVNASSRQVGSLIGQHANVSVLTNGEIHYYSTSDPGYIVVISDSFYTV